ncbi:MAG: FAD-dependent oxidoreductase [Planctomycetes bacterium]|nr:FAD-dependent oxidoreductase [Planctomycetota bacterium]
MLHRSVGALAPSRPQRPTVAVVGAGIAGLGCARALAREFHVEVFEALPRAGGHANTVDVPTASGPLPIDTGFIVYNERNYPRLTRLFGELGVKTTETCMSFSSACEACRFELGSNRLSSLFPSVGAWLEPSRWRLLAGLMRFFRVAKADLAAGTDLSAVTIGEYLREHHISELAARHFVLPMGAAVWSMSAERMLDFPAESFLRFFDNHGMLGVREAPQWRTVVGGSRNYVAKLIESSGFSMHLSAPIARILRRSDGVHLETAAGEKHLFDSVVLATHAPTTLRMLGDATEEERAILGSVGVTRNEAYLHSDSSRMPRARAAWASWNHRVESCTNAGAEVEVTYWMTRLQPLPSRPDYFVTLNPTSEIAESSLIQQITYAHPRFDLPALKAQKRLPEIQGTRRTWFCGAWTSFGFHEDGLRSGELVAEQVRESLRAGVEVAA